MDRTTLPPSSAPPSLDELAEQHKEIAELLRSEALLAGDLDRALAAITEAATRLLQVRRASVWYLRDGGGRIECVDLFDGERHGKGAGIGERAAPRYFEALHQARTIAAHDVTRDDRTRELVDGYLTPLGITSMLDAPFFVQGRLTGVLCHEHVGPRRVFQPWEQLVAGTLADLVGTATIAAENAAQARELGALKEGLERLVAARTEELRRSRESLARLFDAAPVAMVATRLGDQRVLMINQRAATMFEVPLADAPGQLAPDFWVRAEDRLHLVKQTKDAGRLEDFEAELRTRSGKRFWASLSASVVTYEGEQTLVVGVHDVTRQKEAEARLRDAATHDALTGLYNRGHLFETAAQLREMATRHGWALSLAIADADHFKDINDRHGHAAGDEALRALARASRAHLRTSDVLARYGGEEIALLMPETALEAAAFAAERLRAAVEAEVVHAAGAEIRLTVSVGVAEWKPGEPIESLFRRADEALYAAKAAGRNRVARG